MDDLERLHEISAHAVRRIHDILGKLLNSRILTLHGLKTVALCCNELLARIPENGELKTLTESAIYAVLLESSIDDCLEDLDQALIRLREVEQRESDRELFEHLFPEYDSDSINYEY